MLKYCSIEPLYFEYSHLRWNNVARSTRRAVVFWIFELSWKYCTNKLATDEKRWYSKFEYWFLFRPRIYSRIIWYAFKYVSIFENCFFVAYTSPKMNLTIFSGTTHFFVKSKIIRVVLTYFSIFLNYMYQKLVLPANERKATK